MSDVADVQPHTEPAELTADLIRRLLIVMRGDSTEDLYWGIEADGRLRFSVDCSDMFMWGCADAEAVSTEADVALLEAARAAIEALGDHWLLTWISDLYATRKRQEQPMSLMFTNYWAEKPDAFKDLFRIVDAPVEV